MAERSYLSIGDVLEQLQDEFPDATISKIRFLESQGLIEPERAASGYRKFYDRDVERLRWIFRQQKEKFLPLRVIRGQLDARSGISSPSPSEPVEPSPNERKPNVLEDRDDRDGAETGGGASTAAVRNSGSSLSSSPTRPVRPSGSAPQDRSGTQARSGTAGRAGTQARSGTPGRAGTAGRAGARARSGTEDRAGEALSNGDAAHRSGASVGRHPASAIAAVAPSPSSGVGRMDPEETGSEAQANPSSIAAHPLAAATGGVSLTLDELSRMSGLSEAHIQELLQMGLIAGRAVFSEIYFDDEALLTARLAAGFLRHGVEPRHLRMYKLAADREAGFFEQIIMPSMRRRDPESRAQAMETLGDLVRLGEQMRAVALRHVLRQAIDPSVRPSR